MSEVDPRLISNVYRPNDGQWTASPDTSTHDNRWWLLHQVYSPPSSGDATSTSSSSEGQAPARTTSGTATSELSRSTTETSSAAPLPQTPLRNDSLPAKVSSADANSKFDRERGSAITASHDEANLGNQNVNVPAPVIESIIPSVADSMRQGAVQAFGSLLGSWLGSQGSSDKSEVNQAVGVPNEQATVSRTDSHSNSVPKQLADAVLRQGAGSVLDQLGDAGLRQDAGSALKQLGDAVLHQDAGTVLNQLGDVVQKVLKHVGDSTVGSADTSQAEKLPGEPSVDSTASSPRAKQKLTGDGVGTGSQSADNVQQAAPKVGEGSSTESGQTSVVTDTQTGVARGGNSGVGTLPSRAENQANPNPGLKADSGPIPAADSSDRQRSDSNPSTRSNADPASQLELPGSVQRIQGSDTSSNQRPNELNRSASSGDPLPSPLQGSAASENQRANSVQGTDTSVNQRANPVQGTDTSVDQRANLVPGTDTSVNQRANLVQGADTSVNQRANLVQGADTSVNQRANLVPGTETSVDQRANLVQGTETSVDQRANLVQGTDTSVNQRANVVPGTETSVNQRTNSVQGMDANSAPRESEPANGGLAPLLGGTTRADLGPSAGSENRSNTDSSVYMNDSVRGAGPINTNRPDAGSESLAQAVGRSEQSRAAIASGETKPSEIVPSATKSGSNVNLEPDRASNIRMDSALSVTPSIKSDVVASLPLSTKPLASEASQGTKIGAVTLAAGGSDQIVTLPSKPVAIESIQVTKSDVTTTSAGRSEQFANLAPNIKPVAIESVQGSKSDVISTSAGKSEQLANLPPSIKLVATESVPGIQSNATSILSGKSDLIVVLPPSTKPVAIETVQSTKFGATSFSVGNSDVGANLPPTVKPIVNEIVLTTNAGTLVPAAVKSELIVNLPPGRAPAAVETLPIVKIDANLPPIVKPDAVANLPPNIKPVSLETTLGTKGGSVVVAANKSDVITNLPSGIKPVAVENVVTGTKSGATVSPNIKLDAIASAQPNIRPVAIENVSNTRPSEISSASTKPVQTENLPPGTKESGNLSNSPVSIRFTAVENLPPSVKVNVLDLAPVAFGSRVQQEVDSLRLGLSQIGRTLAIAQPMQDSAILRSDGHDRWIDCSVRIETRDDKLVPTAKSFVVSSETGQRIQVMRDPETGLISLFDQSDALTRKRRDPLDFITNPGSERYLTGIELAVFIAVAGITKVRDDSGVDGRRTVIKTRCSIAKLLRKMANIQDKDLRESEQTSDVQPDCVHSNAPSKDVMPKVLTRPLWFVSPGDTLNSIAERTVGDAALGWLIADLNKSTVEENWIDGKRLVELHTMQRLELPVWQDIVAFRENRPCDAAAENLITFVSQRHIDKEVVAASLEKAMGLTPKGVRKAGLVNTRYESQRACNIPLTSRTMVACTES